LSASSLDLYSSSHRLNDFNGWESHQDLSVVPPPSRRTLPSSISQNLNPETVHSGFAASYLPPVKAVPKLLKSLLPGGKEDSREQTAVHQQSLPRIMVQSASVEEGMNKHQQPIPIEEIIPADIQVEIPRSMPLPPPIIPETEESTPSPVSEASSGYMSTSISTATLSEVYTLSWDLPQSSGFEMVPDEEDEDNKPQQSNQDTATIDSTNDPAPNLILDLSEDTAPSSEPPGDTAHQAPTKELSTSEASDPNGASILTSSSAADKVQQESPADASTKATTSTTAPTPLSNIQPSKPAAVANPFKIQKVKSSDLKSFQRILGEEETGHMDQASSLGTGLNLSVPVESLEIISDSEEGDAAATTVLPDWLKEGEFVTVGTNKTGTVRYVGPTDFAAGTWVGVELEVPAGKNDGSVGGKHYFHCNPGYGVLVRPDRVTRGGAKRRRQQQKRRSANLSGSSPNLAALTALAKGEAGVASTSRSKGENRKSWNT
ncbi:kinesin-like protein KIF13B, partial [Lates japonicus]